MNDPKRQYEVEMVYCQVHTEISKEELGGALRSTTRGHFCQTGERVSECDLMKGKLNVQSELDSYLDIPGAEWILTGINWL